ncbi:SU10 major capsid protein [Bacillus licheniformis]|uniref:SU10 major capsid protein n=1 Tax=Bacillus licheniformis TaxID=1402 RepID=UPI003315C388
MSKILSGELVGKRESVVDEILLLNEHQTPLLNLLGFSDPVTQVEHQWFEDEMFADKSTTTVAKTAEDTKITVEDIEPFMANQVIEIGEELIKVVSIYNKTLTVERGDAGTTPAEIPAGAVVEVQFVEGQEGADARDARYKPRKRVSNITQIFDETISITGTAAVVSNYGIDDLYEYEKQKRQLELALQLEKAAINGIKYESTDGIVRQMEGMRQFIQTNVIDAQNGALTDEKINDAMQKIYERGGFTTGGIFKIMVGAKQKRAISNFDKSKINLTRADNGRGQVVDHFVSDFGQAEIVLNNNLKGDELFIFDANRTKIKPLKDRGFFHEYLGRKGDRFEGQIVGEYTLEFLQEKAHARIKGLA